jgi:hypothetical protein
MDVHGMLHPMLVQKCSHVHVSKREETYETELLSNYDQPLKS